MGTSLEPGAVVALGCEADVGDSVPIDGGLVPNSGVGTSATGDDVPETAGAMELGAAATGDAVGKCALADVGAPVLGEP